MIRLTEIDFDAARQLADHCRVYPDEGPLLPEKGVLLAIKGDLLAFAGKDGKNDGFILGINRQPGCVWQTLFIDDYAREDLYCRFVSFEMAGTTALHSEEDDALLPQSAPCRQFQPLIIRAIYEHDLHDHSYAPSVASVSVRFSLDCSDERLSLLEISEDAPPTIERHQSSQMQPGDFKAIGALQLQRFRIHFLNQFRKSPINAK